MNRRQFMKELGTGLFETFREAAAPLLEKDLKKLSRLADSLRGYKYCGLSLPADPLTGIVEQRVSGIPLLIDKADGEWKVYSGLCPGCGQLLHYLSYSMRIKCFGCEKEYGFGADSQLRRFPLRFESGRAYVGLPCGEGSHA